MEVLWEEKIKRKSGFFSALSNLFLTSINVGVGLLAFVGFFFLDVEGRYLGLVLALVIGFFLYSIIKDLFFKVWFKINRTYAIDEEGVHFRWGVVRDHSLFVPFERIKNINFVRYDKSAYSTIFFDTTDPTILKQYPFLAEDGNLKLCFDYLKTGEEANALLQELHSKSVLDESFIPDEKTVYDFVPVWLYRVNMAVAFCFLMLGIFYLVSILDFHLFSSADVTTTIVSQEREGFYDTASLYKLTTNDGHVFHLQTSENLLGKTVELSVSPLFKNVIYKEGVGYLLTPYFGLASGVRFLTVVCLLLAGIYILYRRGYISLEDLGLMIALPILMLILTNTIFQFSVGG